MLEPEDILETLYSLSDPASRGEWDGNLDNLTMNPTRTGFIFDDSLFFPEGRKVSVEIHPRSIEVDTGDARNAIPHRHNFVEMMYVYSGSCTQTIESRTVTLNTGDICILDCNVFHSVAPTGPDDLIINLLMKKEFFDANFFKRFNDSDLFTKFFTKMLFTTKNTHRFMVFNTENAHAIRSVIDMILLEHFNELSCSDDIIESELIILFVMLLRIYQQSVDRVAIQEFGSSIADITSAIVSCISADLEHATRESVAARLGYTPTYLSELLKKLTGSSFSELRNEVRLREAARLLDKTTISITETAAMAGFSNMTYFYRQFKASFGVTPNEYRQMKASKA